MIKYYHAASAASFSESSQVFTCAVHPAYPRPLLDDRTTPRQIIAMVGPGRSGRVRVHPDRFSFYESKTYVACPGGPGEIQHIARAHARAVIFFFSSDIYFYLLLKVPGQPGQLFNIKHFRSDIHPDAPGPLGPISICGGLSLCH